MIVTEKPKKVTVIAEYESQIVTVEFNEPDQFDYAEDTDMEELYIDHVISSRLVQTQPTQMVFRVMPGMYNGYTITESDKRYTLDEARKLIGKELLSE